MAADENPAARLRVSAMNVLARREHSRLELEQKLRQRFPEHQALIPEVLDRLADQGLQCDERYVESFCRSRISRGQGPARIKNELRLKGVGEGLADRILDALQEDWFELARSVARRRFGEDPPDEPRELARRMRFLRYRGFSQDQVRYALEAQEAD